LLQPDVNCIGAPSSACFAAAASVHMHTSVKATTPGVKRRCEAHLCSASGRVFAAPISGCIWRPGTVRFVPAKQRVLGPPRFARSGVNLVIQQGIAEPTVPYPAARCSLSSHYVKRTSLSPSSLFVAAPCTFSLLVRRLPRTPMSTRAQSMLALSITVLPRAYAQASDTLALCNACGVLRLGAGRATVSDALLMLRRVLPGQQRP
jgi:hypothetical protein